MLLRVTYYAKGCYASGFRPRNCFSASGMRFALFLARRETKMLQLNTRRIKILLLTIATFIALC